ncbi:MAG TPA: GMC family oxidoreductase [Thermoanaerobaculia bacterium]|nr:GMC family oxidoreductase [Thermoanaerobaculia bacterium]
MTRVADAVIVGSGAGGGPLALVLAEAGLDVVVLEKGPRHTREEYAPDELAVLGRRFLVPDLAGDPHTVVTRTTTKPQRTDLGWIACCVGGGTVHMGSFLYRFHPDDFRMRSRFGPYLELADWPYGYDELEPWYGRAEREVGVSGQAGANPFEGPRSRPYPLPPLDAHPLAVPLAQACRQRGLHPFPTPRGINSRPYGGRPACAYCTACASYGCRTGAKGSSQEALLPRAEATGHCEVRPRSAVREVTVDRAGRATGCVYLDEEGREHEVRARVVCVAASAVESARLLLLSRSPRFPDGLANGSGLVGRHLQFHGVTMGQATFRRGLRNDRSRNLPLDVGLPFLGVSAMDHYFLPEGVAEIAKGGLLRWDLGVDTPLAAAQGVAFGTGGTPLWGAALRDRLREHFADSRTAMVEVFHDFLPNSGTFVELDPEVRDRRGLPVARIHLDLPAHHARAGRWVLDRAFEVFADLGAEDLQAGPVGGTSAYLVHGTCRAGHDPETSVLDPFCRAHELPNLYVVDGSFLPTSGGAPATLTILANSFRTAEHIAERFRAGEL